jgi:hypothetical protein
VESTLDEAISGACLPKIRASATVPWKANRETHLTIDFVKAGIEAGCFHLSAA